MRPSHRAARGPLRDGIPGEGEVVGQHPHDRLRPVHTRLSGQRQHVPHVGVGAIVPVGEQVNRGAAMTARDLDAGDESHPGIVRRRSRLVPAPDAVVVGQRDHIEARIGGLTHHLGG
ncbi:hypothetical protein GCM10025876_26280 [Demequina litorisediminis]|uniref:Uncharacterized protein n=1 Tax=Demequina litorisediminis TaxID=1849022 RepID=A0ABQ6IFB3_9MICO|nr:hypothetical protein GCM10025876_26280 [Demequina litorisediminis]